MIRDQQVHSGVEKAVHKEADGLGFGVFNKENYCDWQRQLREMDDKTRQGLTLTDER